MNVYICYRPTKDSYTGSLIIAANDEREVISLYHKKEMGRLPKEIILMRDVSAEGTPRILYDDFVR